MPPKCAFTKLSPRQNKTHSVCIQVSIIILTVYTACQHGCEKHPGGMKLKERGTEIGETDSVSGSIRSTRRYIYTGARMLGVVPRGSPSSEIYPWLKTAFVSGILFQERGINFRIRGYWRQSTSKNAAGQNRLVDTTESKQNPVINVANQSIRKYQCLMRVNYFRARSGMTLKTNKSKTNKPRNKQK